MYWLAKNNLHAFPRKSIVSYWYTLIGLKRLMELVEHGDGKLSVVLAGHPKLKDDLQRPTMEEVGFRTEVFSLDRITGSQREYIQWLLACCSQGWGKVESILTEDAIDLLATKLRTPLQVQRYLTLALEAAYQVGENHICRSGRVSAIATD